MGEVSVLKNCSQEDPRRRPNKDTIIGKYYVQRGCCAYCWEDWGSYCRDWHQVLLE